MPGHSWLPAQGPQASGLPDCPSTRHEGAIHGSRLKADRGCREAQVSPRAERGLGEGWE